MMSFFGFGESLSDRLKAIRENNPALWQRSMPVGWICPRCGKVWSPRRLRAAVRPAMLVPPARPRGLKKAKG